MKRNWRHEELRFRLYPEGDVHFVDKRVTQPVTFAHVADLHLLPHPAALWPLQYREAMGWWDKRFGHPHDVLSRLLDDIRARNVDFVLFGGDNLDCYQPEAAEHLLRQCRARGLVACFQLGNHDWQPEPTRYAAHECEEGTRKANCRELMRRWDMPGPYYAFERRGVRFIVLDTPYAKLKNGDYAGTFDKTQVDWFTTQLDWEGPIIAFHHVPFNLPTLERRLRAVWLGILGSIRQDRNGRKVSREIRDCANVLGTFTAHAHMRSEDPMGRVWQFMAPPAHEGQWRCVTIAATAPPKSVRVPGEPTVASGA